MASIEPYNTKDGRRYRVRYRDHERKSRERAGFIRRRDAEDFLAEVHTQVRLGTFIAPESGRTSISDLAADWLQGKTLLKASSYRPLEIAWRRHVAPKWGARRIGEIRHSEVQLWVTEMSASGLSATSVIRASGVLSGILELATRDRLIASNPATRIRKPRRTRKGLAFLTIEQLELLADESKSHRCLVLLLGWSGLRWGEATALRVKHVNFLRRRLQIEENAVDVGGVIHVGTPKTHERREIGIPSFLLQELARQVADRGPENLVFGDGQNHLHRPDSRRGWFEMAVVRSQRIDSSLPRITPHDLRHTAASIAIDSGANIKALQSMLGHASAAMTLDVCTRTCSRATRTR